MAFWNDENVRTAKNELGDRRERSEMGRETVKGRKRKPANRVYSRTSVRGGEASEAPGEEIRYTLGRARAGASMAEVRKSVNDGFRGHSSPGPRANYLRACQ